jgi:hypothetical protein
MLLKCLKTAMAISRVIGPGGLLVLNERYTEAVGSGSQLKACWDDNLVAGGLVPLKNSLCGLETKHRGTFRRFFC